jgi:hypothetical protein
MKIAHERISISLRLERADDGSAAHCRQTFAPCQSKRGPIPCTLWVFQSLDWQLVWQSRRDCGPKPRVGAPRAYPGKRMDVSSTPLGLLSHWTVTRLPRPAPQAPCLLIPTNRVKVSQGRSSPTRPPGNPDPRPETPDPKPQTRNLRPEKRVKPGQGQSRCSSAGRRGKHQFAPKELIPAFNGFNAISTLLNTFKHL